MHKKFFSLFIFLFAVLTAQTIFSAERPQNPLWTSSREENKRLVEENKLLKNEVDQLKRKLQEVINSDKMSTFDREFDSQALNRVLEMNKELRAQNEQLAYHFKKSEQRSVCMEHKNRELTKKLDALVANYNYALQTYMN